MPKFRYDVSWSGSGGEGNDTGIVIATSRADAVSKLAARHHDLGHAVAFMSLEPKAIEDDQDMAQRKVDDANDRDGNTNLQNGAVCRVFVYGTLKAQHGNHPLLQRGGASLLGRFALDGDYAMVSLGGFPGVVITGKKENQTSPIYGEVYGISEECLHSLDLLEGHPDFYQRTKVVTDYGRAWVYMLPRTFLDNGECPLVAEGVWRPTDDESEWISELQGASAGDDARAGGQ